MTRAALSSALASPPTALAAFGVGLAAILFGIVPYFARELTAAGMAPHAVAFYRYLLTALVLLPVILRAEVTLTHWAWALGGGAAMALGWIGYVRALDSVPVATLGVLYMTYPAFTVGLAWALFGDRPTLRATLAAGLIVLAAAVVAGPALGGGPVLAMLWALTAPLGFGLGIVALVHRLADSPTLFRLGATTLGGVIGILPLILTTPLAEVVPTAPRAAVLIIGIALLSAFVPQLIYVVCSPIIGATRTAVIGSLELPTMIVLAVLAFGEPLTLPQAAGCALVLAAIWLTRSRATRNVATQLTRR